MASKYTLEPRIISEIIRSGSLGEAINSGLKAEHFKSAEYRNIYKLIETHWYHPSTRNEVPLLETLQQRYPNFKPTEGSEKQQLKSLIKELRIQALGTDLRTLGTVMLELAEDDPEDALQVIKSKVCDIDYRFHPTKGFGVKEIVAGTHAAYAGAKDGTSMGVPYPWDCLTKDTMGKKRGDLIVFYGRMKSMKCVCEGQRIQINGSSVPIEELPEYPVVPSYTEKTGRVRMAEARRVFSGVKNCVEITTESGLKLKSGDQHLYSVPGNAGWNIEYRRAKNLAVGDLVGTVAPSTSTFTWSPVKSHQDIGRHPCYDICILDGQDPNFIVEGFVVHNTWLLLKCAADDFMKHNQRVMIWSKEMTEDKLQLRMGSLLSNVDYQLLKNGTLPKRIATRAFHELDQLVGMMRKSEEQRKAEAQAPDSIRDIITLCGRKAPKDIAGLSGAIEAYQPDVVYVDSFYHLNSNRISDKAQLWHKITSLAEDLKEMAMEHPIPVIIAAQANRLGEKTMGANLAEVAGADAIGREADLIMRVVKRKGKALHEADYELAAEQEDHKPNRRLLIPKSLMPADDDDVPRVGAELAIILGGNREGVLEAFTMHAVPGYNFSVIDTSFDTQSIHDWAGADRENEPQEIANSTPVRRKKNKADKTYDSSAFRR